MRKLVAVAVSCMAVVSLAACGSSSKKSSSGTTETTKAAASAGVNAAAADLLKYCDTSKAAQDVNAANLLGNSDLKSSLSSLNANLDTWVKVAPAEIKGDVQIEVDKALKPLINELARVNYDFTKADVSKLQGLNTAEVQAAGTRIDAYYTAHCNK
jgi:hypothetical protein